MKRFLPYLACLLLLLATSCGSKLPKKPSWETMFLTADKEFQKGNYTKAQEYAVANHKVIKKQYQDQNTLKAWVNVYQAQIAQAKARFPDMESQIEVAKNILEMQKDSLPEHYLTGMCRIGKIYKQIGNWRKVLEFVEPLKKFAEERNLPDAFLKAEIDYLLVYAYVYTEHYEQAQKILPELIITYTDLQKATGDKKNPILPAQKTYKGEQLGKLYVLKAELLRLHGDYKMADSTLKAHEATIKKVGANTSAIVFLLTCKGDIAFDNEEYEKAIDYFKQARSTCAGENQDYIKITEKLARAYIFDEDEGNAKNQIEIIERIGDSYHQDGNLYTVLSEVLDAEDILHFNDPTKEDLKQTEKARAELVEVANVPTTILPAYHPLQIRIWEKMYQSYVRGSTPEWAMAEKALKKIIELAPKIYGEDTPYKNYYLTILGDSYLTYTDNFDEGRDILSKKPYQTLLERRSESHKDYLELNNAVVNYYDIIDNYKAGLPLAEKAVQVQLNKYGENDISYGRQLIRLAQMQVKAGKYKEADQNTQIALKIIRKEASKKSVEYAEALTSMAKIYGIMGLYDDAEDLLRTSQKIYDKLDIEDATQMAKSIEELAFLYVRIGKYAQTEEILNNVIFQKEKRYGKESHNLVNPLNQIANLYLIKGDYVNAEKNANRARLIAQKIYGEDNVRAAESYHLLSRYNQEIGDLDKAKEWLQKVIAIQESHLGMNHVELGHSYMEMAIIRFQQNAKNINESHTLIGKAKRIMRTNFDETHPLYADVLKAEGLLFAGEKKYESAIQTLQTANKIWLAKLERRNINSASIYSILGDVYAKMKKFDNAKENYTKAEEIYRKVLSAQHPDYVKNQSSLGRMFFVKGDLKRANDLLEQTTTAYLKFIRLYFPALSEREKARYWNKIKNDFEFYNTLAIKQKDTRPELLEKMYNFRLATKAILLSSSIKVRQTILSSKDEDLKDKFKAWLRRKEELTLLLSLSDEQIAENEVKPEKLLEEINALEKELNEKSDAFASSFENEAYTWEQVRETLKSNEAAVEVIRYRQYEDGFTNKIAYVMLVVTPKTRKSPKLVLLGDGNELEGKYLKNYRSRVKHQSRDKESYKRYWQPLEAELGEASIVYLSPDGVYNQINPESIFIEANDEAETETYVIDKINVRLVSNTKDLIQLAKRKEAEKAGKKRNRKNVTIGKKTAFLLGDPDFYVSAKGEREMRNEDPDGTKHTYVPSLPGTELEISEIQSILKQNGFEVFAYTKRDALEEKLKNAEAPKIIHIATHGFFDADKTEEEEDEVSSVIAAQRDPLRKSGILAANAGELLAKNVNNYDAEDGILTASEAMNMALDGTEIVILSACETGLGEVQDGEGVYGLQRAFQVAGSQAVMMSLFKVNDEATARLMVRFYNKWVVTNDKRKAFNEAQRELKREYKKPIFWGAFTMVGAE